MRLNKTILLSFIIQFTLTLSFTSKSMAQNNGNPNQMNVENIAMEQILRQIAPQLSRYGAAAGFQMVPNDYPIAFSNPNYQRMIATLLLGCEKNLRSQSIEITAYLELNMPRNLNSYSQALGQCTLTDNQNGVKNQIVDRVILNSFDTMPFMHSLYGSQFTNQFLKSMDLVRDSLQKKGEEFLPVASIMSTYEKRSPNQKIPYYFVVMSRKINAQWPTYTFYTYATQPAPLGILFLRSYTRTYANPRSPEYFIQNTKLSN